LAAALQALPGGSPPVVAIMCRNHRGFVEALVAANRIGADVLLLNTSFAGPALAEVVEREGADAIIYDEEFTGSVDRALADRPDTTRIVAWADHPESHELTVEKLIAAHAGQRPASPQRKGKLILLTSGTTGTPKGAKRSGGGASELKAILDLVPWRAEETTVVVAPMFHAWGFSQLVFAASLGCTVVTRRKFDPEATLELIDRYQAAGLCVVPVMFDRIMELPDEVRRKYSGRSLRFATASGSRMRPDVVTRFMDEFGDVIYNNYNATEAGMIATATPEDLRAAPDTAGKPAPGTEIRILDSEFRPVPTGEVGQIFVRNSSLFDGYTSGSTKDFHDGFMASGDVGRLDEAGRLYVVGRDDEMIVSGGENVYPIEVEKTLTAHPEVEEAAVLGVDDEQYGQRLAAFVVLTSGASATPDDLKQHVRDNLANYKVPREIVIVDELPRSSTGKIHRGELLARIGNAG
jgi:acyl-CoA synthetase (AMP-forming)/AMP-acid ligase II